MIHDLLSRFHRLPRAAAVLFALNLASASWTKADVSTDELPVLTGTTIHTVTSEAVGDDFVLYVRVPPEAASEPERTFPVIYALDGDHTFPMMASIVTELGFSGSAPPAIIVGIGYGTLDLENGNHRGRDLSPQPLQMIPGSGGGPEFLSFLIEEVFPLIESKYPADSEERYLFGHSLGGLFALYTYTREADAFAGIVAGSPALIAQLPFLEESAENSEPRTCRLAILTGDEEDAALFINDLEPLKAKLEGGWATAGSYEMALLPGFDHFTMVAPSISKGLKFVFAENESESETGE
jgi:hypothetical protein